MLGRVGWGGGWLIACDRKGGRRADVGAHRLGRVMLLSQGGLLGVETGSGMHRTGAHDQSMCSSGCRVTCHIGIGVQMFDDAIAEQLQQQRDLNRQGCSTTTVTSGYFAHHICLILSL